MSTKPEIVRLKQKNSLTYKKAYLLTSLILIMLLVITTSSAKEYIILENNIKGLSIASSNIPQEKINHKFSTFNGFIANLSEEEYNKVLLDPRYTIAQNRNFSTMLDTSVPQVEANDSWVLLQNQTNLTGTGQTVCVIDTGVDYNHPAFGGCYGNNNASSNCTVIGGYDFIGNDNDPIDINGHGTHTAGIIASQDGAYTGVAPGTKIIAIKSLDDAGSGNSSSVGAGIDWCVANKSKFNISVITLSLGATDTYYNTTCDNDFPTLRNAIRSAVAENITVTISSGNCNSYGGTSCTREGITGPACIHGVIPVGAVNGGDALQYQRGELYQIFAPGVSITSINEGGSGTATLSGTSEAAPHVAGLIAILNQFNNLQTGLNLTNKTVKETVNQTDTYINDASLTGNTYPRINFIKALYALDQLNPNITQTLPANATINSSANQTFTIDVEDFALQNITVSLYNQTSLVNQSNSSISGQSTTYQATFINLPSGEYSWSTTVYDQNNNSFTTQNYTLTISSSTTINSPENNTYTNTESNLTCTSKTSSDTELDNITVQIWNSSNTLVFNQTKSISGTTNTSIFNYTWNTEDSYTWTCNTFNNISEQTTSQNYTITYDNTNPNLTIITPLPTSVTASSASKTFYFNASDNNINATCELIYSDTSQESKVITNYSITNNFTKTLSTGTYTWNINCTDQAGNVNASNESTFTITAPSSGSGGSGGGGGSSSSGGGGGVATTYIKGSKQNPFNETDLKTEKNYLLRRTLSVYIKNRYNEVHKITLNGVKNKVANITVESKPINLLVQDKDIIKLNLSSPQYYDLQIEIIQVSDSFVTMNLTEIQEEHPNYVPINFSIQNETPEDRTVPNPKYNSEKPIKEVIILTIIFSVLLVIVIIIYKGKISKTTRELNIKKLKSNKKK